MASKTGIRIAAYNRKAATLESYYCDYTALKIQALASALFSEDMTDKQKAVKAFSWVRDNIKYRLGFCNRKASETLEELKGADSNKANLLVALLMSQRIPARYSVLEVLGKKYFGLGCACWEQRRSSKTIRYVYTCVKLGRR